MSNSETDLNSLKERVQELESENAQLRRETAKLRLKLPNKPIPVEQTPSPFSFSNLSKGPNNDREWDALLARMPGIVFRRTLDFQRPYIWIAGNCHQVFGLSAEEFLALKQSVQLLIHKEDLSQLQESVHEALKQDKAYHTSFRIWTVQNEWLWVRETGRFVPDVSGTFAYVEGAMWPITKEVMLERALRESENRYELLTDSMEDVITLADLNRQSSYISPSFYRMSGYTPEDIASQDFRERVHPEDRDKVELARQANLKGEATRIEWRFKRKDGTFLWMETCANPITAPNGDIIRIGCCSRNITRRKQAEEERERIRLHLEQSRKWESLGILAGGVAHDFNNLLTTVLGYSSLIRADLFAESQMATMMDQVIASTKKAAELTKQILAYAGKVRYHIEPISFSDMMADLKDSLSGGLPKNVKLVWRNTLHLPEVNCDRAQIKQLILNLVTNSLEAMESDGGTLTVRTGIIQVTDPFSYTSFGAFSLAPGLFSYVEVSDTGCGMPEEVIQKIFDPFYSSKFLGRGLGLASALGIAKGHHGMIRVQSKPNSGSSFQLLLPISATS